MSILYRIRFDSLLPLDLDTPTSRSSPSSPDINANPPDNSATAISPLSVLSASEDKPQNTFSITSSPLSFESHRSIADLQPLSLSGSLIDKQTSSPSASSNPPTTPSSASPNDSAPLVRAEVRQMIDEALNGLKVYVLESDITQAQQAVKSIVELASF